MQQIERRRMPRYPLRVPVTVVACDGTITGVHGHTADMSGCGFRVITEADLRHGVEQTVMIDTLIGPIVARVDIIRTERRGSQWVHGLVITEIEDDDAALLNELCLQSA